MLYAHIFENFPFDDMFLVSQLRSAITRFPTNASAFVSRFNGMNRMQESSYYKVIHFIHNLLYSEWGHASRSLQFKVCTVSIAEMILNFNQINGRFYLVDVAAAAIILFFHLTKHAYPLYIHRSIRWFCVWKAQLKSSALQRNKKTDTQMEFVFGRCRSPFHFQKKRLKDDYVNMENVLTSEQMININERNSMNL